MFAISQSHFVQCRSDPVCFLWKLFLLLLPIKYTEINVASNPSWRVPSLSCPAFSPGSLCFVPSHTQLVPPFSLPLLSHPLAQLCPFHLAHLYPTGVTNYTLLSRVSSSNASTKTAILIWESVNFLKLYAIWHALWVSWEMSTYCLYWSYS